MEKITDCQNLLNGKTYYIPFKTSTGIRIIKIPSKKNFIIPDDNVDDSNGTDKYKLFGKSIEIETENKEDNKSDNEPNYEIPYSKLDQID